MDKKSFRILVFLAIILNMLFFTARFVFAVWQDNPSAPPSNNVQLVVYSETCADWATKGWSSKGDCLHDGRWHRVLSNSPLGAATFGSVADVAAHIRDGSDVRVYAHTADFSIFCNDVSLALGMVVCSDPLHHGVWDIAADTGHHLGSSVLYSDGRIIYAYTADAYTKNLRLSSSLLARVAMDWFIRY
jgi:hypothetical protein